MTFEFDVELVVRLDNIVIEADSVGEAKREAKQQCREFGNIVDFRITENGASG